MVKLVMSDDDPGNPENFFLKMTFTDFVDSDRTIIDTFLSKSLPNTTKIMLLRIDEGNFVTRFFFGKKLVYVYECSQHQPPAMDKLIKSIEKNRPENWQVEDNTGVRSRLEIILDEKWLAAKNS